ncbi:iduronate 2-sulfatase-like [Dreissena polymorpha]|uniref:Sulfatase N-terminal domain-containing protein n=1 Tax=Dreissena polymorpha TaxID=45954 RepID=A0A9D4IJA3_DREPO|nr:iduronate 2-sulfatase-like [Dreissena polymorpha]KAH3775129.1 hypothetical protein DPMN_176526 [Dreissena polymorpha]
MTLRYIRVNIDALVRKSLLLKKAYVQQALCSPSRTSFLTSRRPDTTHVYDLETYWRKVSGNFTTIPQYFKKHGRLTASIGKIFHPVGDSHDDAPFSWTDPYIMPRASRYEVSEISWMYLNDSQLLNDPLVDDKIAKAAVSALQNFATGGKYANRPFFLASIVTGTRSGSNSLTSSTGRIGQEITARNCTTTRRTPTRITTWRPTTRLQIL